MGFRLLRPVSHLHMQIPQLAAVSLSHPALHSSSISSNAPKSDSAALSTRQFGDGTLC